MINEEILKYSEDALNQYKVDLANKEPFTPFKLGEEDFFELFKRNIHSNSNMSLFMEHYIKVLKKLNE